MPSLQCRRRVHPEKYGITVNEGQRFNGDRLVVFYEDKLGLLPYCEPVQVPDAQGRLQTGCKPVNGGVPQVCIFTRAHDL